MKPVIIVPIVALALAAGGAGAYFWLTSGGSEQEVVAQPTPTATTAPTVTPTAEPTPTPEPSPGVPADWLTYTDAVLGFSLRYPPDWHLSPAKGGGELTALYSYDPTRVPPEQAGMPVSRDKLKAEILVLDNPEGLSMEAWIRRDRERGAPVLISSRSAITVDNTSGIAETVELGEGGSAVQYFFPKGADVYVIVKYPADSLLSRDFATILGSFRFTAAQ